MQWRKFVEEKATLLYLALQVLQALKLKMNMCKYSHHYYVSVFLSVKLNVISHDTFS